MEQTPKANIRVDYQKCKPDQCSNDGACPAAEVCPVKALRQEEKNDFPFLHPSKFCRGCQVCAEKCPLQAIEKL
ncbi:MAG: hypothetical protein A2Z02_00865 [Chloroflexi bacterium RBG_16_48_7]|nr:MAG: hypothetical protein A2Z02_00865 [Chloroflexi bacterium RBG_16_48_7]